MCAKCHPPWNEWSTRKLNTMEITENGLSQHDVSQKKGNRISALFNLTFSHLPNTSMKVCKKYDYYNVFHRPGTLIKKTESWFSALSRERYFYILDSRIRKIVFSLSNCLWNKSALLFNGLLDKPTFTWKAESQIRLSVPADTASLSSF